MADPSSLIFKVGGVDAGELKAQFRREVADLLGRSASNFPGAQPVSFAARHIAELRRQDYYVCEKTDGIRYLMYMTRDGDKDIHYLIDRKNDYYYVRGLHFPHQDDPTFARFHEETILDGELVEDRPPNGPPELKYLVFDCLVLDGQRLLDRPLDKRLGYFKEYVLKPYKAMFAKFPQEIAMRPFAVEDKSTQFSYALEMMFKQIIPSVKQLHGNDGLIFTCRNTPYQFGTDEHILKWKPPHDNTVDFLLHIVWHILEPDGEDPDQTTEEDYLSFPDGFELYIHHGGKGEYSYHGSMYVTQIEWEGLKALQKPLQDCVVECYLEPASDGVNGDGPHPPRWRLYRIRDDKTDGNYVTVVQSVMESIEDQVTEEDLLRAAPEIRTEWKNRQAEEKRREEAKRRHGHAAPRNQNGEV
jgi:mRNA guanylyltransferase